MRLTQRSLLPRAILCACRSQLKMIFALGLLALPAAVPVALGAQTLTYLGQQSTITYNQGEGVPQALAVDSVGNLYVADLLSESIIKIALDGTQTNVGSVGNANGLAVDASGNLYVTTGEGATGSVIKIAPNGAQTNINITGMQGSGGVAVDSYGNLFVADQMGSSVYEVFAVGGQATIGSEIYGADGVAVDPAGNVYVSDGAGPIYKITPEGVQTEIVSDSYFTFGVSVDAHGNVFYSNDNDEYSNGDVYELEGSTPVGFGVGTSLGAAIGNQGNLYGIRYGGGIEKVNLGAADFGSANVCPGMATTPSPCTQSLTLNFVVPATQISVAFADTSATVTTNGAQDLDFSITSNTCTGTSSGNSSCAVTLQFRPLAPGVRSGALDILGSLNSGPQGSLATVQVHGLGLASLVGFDSEIISTPPLTFTNSYLAGVTVDASENLYVSDASHCVIVKWNAFTYALGTAAGTGTCSNDGVASGGPAIATAFSNVQKVAVDGRGNLYFADYQNRTEEKVDALTGNVSVIAGVNGTTGSTGDGGLAIDALFEGPSGSAVDAAGNIYISDQAHNTVRRVDGTTGVITTVAGDAVNGNAGSSGDGGPATSALLNGPYALEVDNAGNLYIDDAGNNVIRKVAAVSGIITTVAGKLPPAIAGYSGDGGLATEATLDNPEGITVDSAGNLYIADSENLVVRKVTALTGIISTIAGTFTEPFNGLNAASTGDGGAATAAGLTYVQDLTLDSHGNLYLVGDLFSGPDGDTINSGLRTVTAASGKLAFGSSTVGVASAYQAVTVTNNGNTPLTFESLSIPLNFEPDGEHFTCADDAPLAPGTNCLLGFDFLPTTSGLLTGTATLIDNDPSLAQSFSLSGTGTSLVNTPTRVALGSYPATLSDGGNLGLLFVSVENASGTVVVAPTDSIHVVITGPGGFSYQVSVPTLGGTGIAFLTSVPFTTPGLYSIVASLGDLIPGTGSFTVLPAGTPPPPAAVKLAFDGVVATLPAGGNLGAVLVSVETSSGSTVATSTASINLTITGPNDLSRSVSASAFDGLAAFDLATIIFDTPGTYTLTASSAGLTSATASVIVVPTEAVATKLAFATVPAAVIQSNSLGNISVVVEYSSGLIDGNSSATVALTITGPAGYSKTGTATAISGVAGFNLSADLLPAAGTYTISVASPGLESANASFTVEQGFTLSLAGGASGSGATQTVAPGAAAVFPLMLAPAGSQFNLPIQLAASGLPPGATYSFSPDIVTPGTAPATSTLTIQTANSTSAVHWPTGRGAGFGAASGELALALLMLPFAASRKLRRIARDLPRLGMMLALLSLAGIAGLTGCSAGGLFTGTSTPTSYTITITGTSGTVVHTTTVTLIEK